MGVLKRERRQTAGRLLSFFSAGRLVVFVYQELR
jgi:hypothetical protein